MPEKKGRNSCQQENQKSFFFFFFFYVSPRFRTHFYFIILFNASEPVGTLTGLNSEAERAAAGHVSLQPALFTRAGPAEKAGGESAQAQHAKGPELHVRTGHQPHE